MFSSVGIANLAKVNRSSTFRSFVRGVQKYAKNDQIYLHKEGGIFKYSLSPNPRALAIGQSNKEILDKIDDFKANQKFIDVLQAIMKKRIYEDFTFKVEAGTNIDSFMPIYDLRDPPRYGRTPEVENVFGYVRVDSKGIIVPDTYEENNFYAVYSPNGLIRLPDGIYDVVKEECEKVSN